ncbi:unnamed protein product [Brachionus calyciflorus]|uniref:U3 small nucleolar RNA-associated protein 20 C-terminal domain-containing protein n=1 Tax=Brachionus calyciflorus TaxID=104777 RepID=A0A813YEQ5_9BILA|nr:unnamed protein product [Brachionus calyciflorus]
MNTNDIVTEKFYDQYLYNLLSLLMKILTDLKIFAVKKYTETINKLFGQVKFYLCHENLWVRLITCQLFANYSIEHLVNDKSSYFNYKTQDEIIGNFLKIRDLIDKFGVQFKSPILENYLAEQIVKNLAFIKVFKELYELVNKLKETIKRTFIFKLFAAISIELGTEKLKDYLNLMIPLLQREIEIDQNDHSAYKIKIKRKLAAQNEA